MAMRLVRGVDVSFAGIVPGTGITSLFYRPSEWWIGYDKLRCRPPQASIIPAPPELGDAQRGGLEQGAKIKPAVSGRGVVEIGQFHWPAPAWPSDISLYNAEFPSGPPRHTRSLSSFSFEMPLPWLADARTSMGDARPAPRR